MKDTKKGKYNADSIVRLQGLEGVRHRPGVYVGDIDSRGLLHMVKEIVGNSVDEAANGHGDTIAIKLEKSGKVTIFDQGRGIPTGPHKSDRKTDTLTIIMTEMHSGGKLKNAAQNYSAGAIGSNGMGLAIVNALSTEMTVYTKSSGKWQQQTFAKGHVKSGVIPSKRVPSFDGNKWPRGTIVEFTPDVTVFEKGSKLTPAAILEWLLHVSWFVYGPKKKQSDTSGKPVTFMLDLFGKKKTIQRKSLAHYGAYTAKQMGAEPLIDELKPFIFTSAGCDVLLFPTTSDAMKMYSSVSSVQTIADGTHVNMLNKLLEGALDKLRPRKMSFKLKDFMTGMVVVCNVKMVESAFAGQSKERLTSKVDGKFDGLAEAFIKWARRNKDAMQTLFDRAEELGSININAALNRKLAAKLKVKKNGKVILPAELVQSTTKNRDERELFLVEGKSAGGTGARGSDRTYQEILPLRGKMLNVVRKSDKQADSQVIIKVLQSIGFDPKKTIDKSRRVGRIYLLTDADADGSHISALLMGLLYTTVPVLFEEKRVFDVHAPLYSYGAASGKIYGSSLKDIQAKVGKGFNAQLVVRMKGWGEAQSDELEEIAFNPKSRKVSVISTAKAAECKHALFAMLGEGPEMRRELLGLQ